MNTTTYDLSLPTENFFSYEWGGVYIPEAIKNSVTVTRSKLDRLGAKLARKVLQDGESNPKLNSFLDRVSWLQRHIGVWSNRAIPSTHRSNKWWAAHMVYPNDTHAIPVWNEEILGERKQDEGYLLVLLSPSTVEWLNMLLDLVTE